MCHIRYIQYPCSHLTPTCRKDFCKEYWAQPGHKNGCPLGRPPIIEHVFMGKAEAALLSAVEGATKSWKRKLGPFFGSPLRALGCKKCYAPTSTELGSLMVREQFNKWTKICDKLVQASNDRLLGKPVEDEKTQKNIEVAERLVKMTHDQEIAGKTPFHEMMTPFEVMFVMLKSESGWSESGEEYSTFDWKQYEASKLAAAEAAETQNAVGPSGSENVSA